MDVWPVGATVRGPDEMFEGEVYLDMFFTGNEDTLLRVGITRFSPGSRTVWHRHARGQVLRVTEGRGLVQLRGSDPVEIGPGDTIWTPADEWHWHGATQDHFMAHLAIWEGVEAGGSEPETEWGSSSRS
jgi:quercetin dioxygenase-like cupin family protein